MPKERYIWDNMAKSFHAFSSRSKAHKDKYLTIAKMIMDANPRNILDLGCGSGLLEIELAKLGYKGEICAVDASEEMLRIAKSICGDAVDFKKMNLDDDFEINKKFDVIVAINVLFFIKDKKTFLNKIKKLLRDSQSFVVLVNPKPNEECSNWQFVKAHFSDTKLSEKIIIFINELINMPRYIKMISGQARLSRMADRGQIIFDHKDNIRLIAKEAGLEIRIIEDIHAGQNWLFVMGTP